MKELTIFLLCILVLSVIVNKMKENKDIVQKTSRITNESFYVRKLEDSQEAADILSKLCQRLEILTKSLQDNKSPECQRLLKRFDCSSLSETVPGSKYTSYSVNKGEQLAICIRNKETNVFLDMNTITFVALHELAHVMTEEIGHTKTFWKNMKFLLEQGEKVNIYKPVDYSKSPVKYCGMTIDSSPYDFTT